MCMELYALWANSIVEKIIIKLQNKNIDKFI